jgi:hypothetical protein
LGYWWWENDELYCSSSKEIAGQHGGVYTTKLQFQASNVPASWSSEQVKELAKAIVAEAAKANATHFYIAGEPTLVMFANLNAVQFMCCVQSTTERRSVETINADGTVTKSSVFEHVQWRVLF